MDGSALFIRRIAYPLMQRFKGNRVLSKRDLLISTCRMSREDLTAFQLEKLRVLLRICNEAVPAYRGRWSAQEIQEDPVRSLGGIQPLSKAAFRDNAEDFIREEIDSSKLIANRTGGSTGEPLRFYMDRETVEWYEAARWRGLSWWGVQPWSRSIMVWGSPIELSQTKNVAYSFKERYLKNRVLIPAYQLKQSKASDYVGLFNKFKPDYLYGYASALGALSRIIERSGLQVTHRPKVIVFTAEGLSPEDKLRIENVFKCPVAGEYGARDAGILAYQCPLGSLHVTVENAFLELIDPSTGSSASSGLLVVTDLNNLAQPRLRYVLGDWATWGGDCSCGINLPTLAGVEGREDAVLVAENGSLVHGHLVAHIARTIEGIQQIQLQQISRKKIKVLIVAGALNPHDRIRTELISHLTKWLGEMEYQVEFVNHIPPTASGKIRYAIRRFPLSGGEAPVP